MDFSFYTKRFVLNLTFSFVMMWLCTEPTLVHGDIDFPLPPSQLNVKDDINNTSWPTSYFRGEESTLDIEKLSNQQFISDENSNCPNLTPSLGEGCSVNYDCTKITCSKRFAGKDITLTLDIDKCGDPVTVTARMQVPDLGIDWSHKYSSDDIVAVPGFTVEVSGLSAGVYVQVQLNSDSSQLHMKVNLLAGGKLFGHSSYPIRTTVVDSDLPVDTSECGIVRWWRELGIALQVVIIGAPILVLIFLITCCCCCCCRNSRGPVSTAGPVAVVIPGTQPNPAIMTTTNSRVPLKPLENMA